MNFRPARTGLMLTMLIGSFVGGMPTVAAAEPVEPTYGQPSPEAARAELNRQQAQDA